MCLSVWYRTYNCTRYFHSANSIHNVTSVREARVPKFVFFFHFTVYVFPLTWEVEQSYTSNAPWATQSYF